ncbi:nucleotidyltransferase domain-containing protein [bacterium]|nr:nucleotidyltransferase domain-containing protein [bacterium]
MAAIDLDILENNSILTEMVQRLVDAFDPECIYLFGSHARGEANPDSDFDLLMILSKSELPRYKRDQAAFRVLCGVGAPKDVIVLTREEFHSKLPVVTSLPATIEREGRLLYAS